MQLERALSLSWHCPVSQKLLQRTVAAMVGPLRNSYLWHRPTATFSMFGSSLVSMKVHSVGDPRRCQTSTTAAPDQTELPSDHWEVPYVFQLLCRRSQPLPPKTANCSPLHHLCGQSVAHGRTPCDTCWKDCLCCTSTSSRLSDTTMETATAIGKRWWWWWGRPVQSQ